MRDKIINFISDRMNTSSVVDALGNKAIILKVNSLNSSKRIVGEVHYLYAKNSSNRITHQDLANAPENKILYIDNFNCHDLALAGHLMAKYAFERKKALGIVVDGCVRDVEMLRGYPIWCTGINPIACSKNPDNLINIKVEQRRVQFQGGIIIADDTACVLIHPRDMIEPTIFALEAIAEREREWFAKLDSGLNTFEITCQENNE